MPKLDHSAQDVEARIGDRIRARRVELGLSQAELAERINMSFQQVQKYESGANRVASSILLRVAEALTCSPGDLLEIGKTRRAKQNPYAVADRDAAVLMQRFRQIKSSKARNRILKVVEALLDEAESQTTLAKTAPPKRKPPKPTKTRGNSRRRLAKRA
jgi:transcriptional regulator with XRE-family HTH domain